MCLYVLYVYKCKTEVNSRVHSCSPSAPRIFEFFHFLYNAFAYSLESFNCAPENFVEFLFVTGVLLSISNDRRDLFAISSIRSVL